MLKRPKNKLKRSCYAQVIDELDRCPYSRLLKYVATDVSASWGAALMNSLKVPALDFKVPFPTCVYCSH